ncbi:MAG: hypothetical protein WD029_09850, partial [Microthrixaceae bacterium]
TSTGQAASPAQQPAPSQDEYLSVPTFTREQALHAIATAALVSEDDVFTLKQAEVPAREVPTEADLFGLPQSREPSLPLLPPVWIDTPASAALPNLHDFAEPQAEPLLVVAPEQSFPKESDRATRKPTRPLVSRPPTTAPAELAVEPSLQPVAEPVFEPVAEPVFEPVAAVEPVNPFRVSSPPAEPMEVKQVEPAPPTQQEPVLLIEPEPVLLVEPEPEPVLLIEPEPEPSQVSVHPTEAATSAPKPRKEKTLFKPGVAKAPLSSNGRGTSAAAQVPSALAVAVQGLDPQSVRDAGPTFVFLLAALQAGEQVSALVQGWVKGSPCVVARTDRRLILIVSRPAKPLVQSLEIERVEISLSALDQQGFIALRLIDGSKMLQVQGIRDAAKARELKAQVAAQQSAAPRNADQSFF